MDASFWLVQKHELMKHVSHQTIVMQFILELAKSLQQDPRSCVRAFFSRWGTSVGVMWISCASGLTVPAKLNSLKFDICVHTVPSQIGLLLDWECKWDPVPNWTVSDWTFVSKLYHHKLGFCETESVNGNLSQTEQFHIRLLCPRLNSLKLGICVPNWTVSNWAFVRLRLRVWMRICPKLNKTFKLGFCVSNWTISNWTFVSQTDQSHFELCETESVNENLSQTDQSQTGLFSGPKLNSLNSGLKTDGCQLVKYVPAFSESSWERSSTWRPSTTSWTASVNESRPVPRLGLKRPWRSMKR